MSEQRKVYTAAIEKAGGDDRTFSATISTADVDRENDRVGTEGWDTREFEKNGPVLFAHRHDAPVGRAISVAWDAVRRRLRATWRFMDPGTFELADAVRRMVETGFLKATSVSFRPLERPVRNEHGGLDWPRVELLEFSIVAVPANPAAVIARAKSLGFDPDPIRRAMAGGADTATLDRIEREFEEKMFGPGDPFVRALGSMASEERFVEREAKRIARQAVTDEMFVRTLVTMPKDELAGVMREAIEPVINREIDRARGRLPD